MPLFAWPNPAESAQVMADISEASAPPPPPPPPWDCRLGGGGGAPYEHRAHPSYGCRPSRSRDRLGSTRRRPGPRDLHHRNAWSAASDPGGMGRAPGPSLRGEGGSRRLSRPLWSTMLPVSPRRPVGRGGSSPLSRETMPSKSLTSSSRALLSPATGCGAWTLSRSLAGAHPSRHPRAATRGILWVRCKTLRGQPA